MEEGEPKPQTEKLGLNKKEVWIVDDEDAISGAIMRALAVEANKGGINMRRFSTAQECLDEIKIRQDENREIAGTILIDKELKQDAKGLQDGSELIKRILANQQIETPNLIAHSSVEEYNKELMQAGAQSAIKKGQVMETRRIIQQLGEEV